MAAGNGMIASALSFLLVFRCGNAFSRWWEARGHLGAVAKNLRQLSCALGAACAMPVPAQNGPDAEKAREEWKQDTSVILISYFGVLASLLHSPGAPLPPNMLPLSKSQINKLESSGMPVYVVMGYWIEKQLEVGYSAGWLHLGRFQQMSQAAADLASGAHGAHKIAS